MWISNLNIIPTVSNLPGQGSSGPAPPADCLIELESGLGLIELESGLGFIELEICPSNNLIAQNNDNLIAQNNDQLIQQ